jgi:hypothetical protein
MLFDLWLALPVALAMVICGSRAWQGDAWSAVVLTLLAVSWLRIDKHFEGPLLLSVSNNHGLVLADLVAGAAVAVVAASYWRHRWTERSLVS